MERAGYFSDRIAGILAHDIDIIWHKVEPYINRALDKSLGELTAYDVYVYLVCRKMQLWLILEDKQIIGIGITEIISHKSKRRECLVRLYSAEHHDFEAAASDIGYIEAWAKDLGCNFMTIVGRKGWQRTLKSAGYEARYTVLAKEF